MSAVLKILEENGLMLLAGTSALLLSGTLLVAVVRAPLHRQRICELSILSTIAWGVLALIPLPRLAWPSTAPLPQQRDDVAILSSPGIEIPKELIAKAYEAGVETKSVHAPAIMHPPQVRPFPISSILALIYLSGAAIFAAWLMLGHLLLWRLIRKAAPAPAFVKTMIDARLIANAPHAPRILIGSDLSRPMTCRTFRPVIILPESLLQTHLHHQLRQALLHELGHVQQRDGLGNFLFSLALPLLYFHPLYWLLRRSNHLARELVVDDLAARSDGKEAYISQLVALARTRGAVSFSPVVSIGILQSRSHFYRRMQMLLQRQKPLATRCSILSRIVMSFFAVGIVMGLAGALGVKAAGAQPVPSKPAAADANPAFEKQVPAQQPQTVDTLSETQIGMIDQHMRKLLDVLDDSRLKLEKARQELGPEHVNVRALETSLKADEKRIENYAAEWRDMQHKLAGRGISPMPSAAGSDTASKTVPTPLAVDSAHVGGVQLDLVQLGNSLVDASGALRLAKVHLDGAVKAGGPEIETAKVNLITAEKRLTLLRGIAEIALKNTQDELNISMQRFRNGTQTEQGLSDLKSKVQVLELILNAAR